MTQIADMLGSFQDMVHDFQPELPDNVCIDKCGEP